MLATHFVIKTDAKYNKIIIIAGTYDECFIVYESLRKITVQRDFLLDKGRNLHENITYERNRDIYILKKIFND